MIIVGVIIGLVYALMVWVILMIPALLISAPIYWGWRLIDDWRADWDDVMHVLTTITIIFSLVIGLIGGIPTAMIDTVEWGEP
jgi:hypothetical protein